MDIKIEIKEEDPPSDNITSQNDMDFCHNVATMKRNSDTVFLVDDCHMPIKTEMKSEILFTEHPLEQIKFETVTCSNNWEIKTEVDQQTLVSDFGLQNKKEYLSNSSVMNNKKYNNVPEMDKNIEIKEEPWWLETETSSVCVSIKDGDFLPGKSSRSYMEVAYTYSDKSPSAEISRRDTNFYIGKDSLECEHEKNSVTKMPATGEHVLSGKFGKSTDVGEMYIKPSYLKQKNLIDKVQRQYKCNICAKNFRCLSHLKMHNLIHEGKKPFQCKNCGKKFTRMSHLKTHNMIHEGKKQHQCKICGRTFTQLANLRRHYFTHEVNKPHQCKDCNKSFTQLGDLKNHYLNHEGKRPYQCQTCNKSFTQLSTLKTHNLIHENKKPHECKTCNKSFARLGDLRKHCSIHGSKNAYQCITCNKGFTRLSYLKTHNLIHEGKKPHQCKTCYKSFTQLSHLKRHNMIHESK